MFADGIAGSVMSLSSGIVVPAEPEGRFVHAVLLADRLSVDRAAYKEMVSATPFAFPRGRGFVVIFRYGVVVLVCLTRAEEREALAQVAPGKEMIEEERIEFVVAPDSEDGITAMNVVQVKELTAARALVMADVLAKSVALAYYEREIASVFDIIEPTAARLASTGRIPKARQELLKLVGAALLAQHRVSGRIAFAEKPDILWDHPELERFYARLEDEYEVVERGTLLHDKVEVVASVAETFTDMIDTARSTRLEILIVVLICAELAVTVITLFLR
jgi:uncharacterized Rmd1/YagE family protein